MHTHASRALWIVPASRVMSAQSRPLAAPAVELHGRQAPGLLQSGLILLTFAILLLGVVVGACDHVVDLLLSMVVR